MNPDQLTNKGDVDFSQVRRDMEARRERAAFAEAELERLHKWIEKERAGASLPPNTVDAIILIAEERGREYTALKAAHAKELSLRIEADDKLRLANMDHLRILHRAHIAEADARQAKARMDSAIEADQRIIENCEEAYAHRISAITTLKDAKEILALLTGEKQ